MATSVMNRVKVTPVVSQTSSKTGALVLVRDMTGASTVEKRAVCPALKAGLLTVKALAEPTSAKNAKENFICEEQFDRRERSKKAFCENQMTFMATLSDTSFLSQHNLPSWFIE